MQVVDVWFFGVGPVTRGVTNLPTADVRTRSWHAKLARVICVLILSVQLW